MKAPILGIVVSAALASSAHAYTVTSASTLPSNPTAPVTLTFTPTVNFNQTGSIPNIERSPYEGTKMPNSPYTSIEGTGSATFNFTPIKNRKLTELTLIWGSPDYFNKIEIYSGPGGTGNLLAQVYGNDPGITPFSGPAPHPVTTPGLGYAFVRINGLSDFRSAVFYNTPGDNAFEISTLSAVPLPASAPLFGAALLALAGFGYVQRTKRSGIAPA